MIGPGKRISPASWKCACFQNSPNVHLKTPDIARQIGAFGQSLSPGTNQVTPMLLAQKALEICLGTQPAIDLCGRNRWQQEKTQRTSECNLMKFVTLEQVGTRELLYRSISFVLSRKSVTQQATDREHLLRQAKAQDFLADPAAGSVFRGGNGYRNALSLTLWIPMDPYGPRVCPWIASWPMLWFPCAPAPLLSAFSSSDATPSSTSEESNRREAELDLSSISNCARLTISQNQAHRLVATDLCLLYPFC